MKSYYPFEDTRPYNDDEIPAAVERVLASPYLTSVFQYLFPNEDIESFKAHFSQIKTIRDFQHQFMYHAMQSIIEQTISEISSAGIEKLDDNKKCMFVSNHRDILMDSALLQVFLNKFNFDTCEITFGSNLMRGQFVIDIGKMNKKFKIVRGGNIRDFYNNSMEVSQYMRYAITEKKQSTWIAQRNGRTKNGIDKTEPALLKMFAMSSQKPFVENFLELNVTPVSISYEYEPCDFLKTRELYISLYQKYEKTADEDLNSILHGIKQYKGKVHLTVCDSINENDLKECDQLEKNMKFNHLANIMDLRIYKNYKLWKTNYIAYDTLHQTQQFNSFYNEQEKSEFQNYMENGLKAIDGNKDELQTIFLEIYANPVKSVLQL
jgi:hypothetical protein